MAAAEEAGAGCVLCGTTDFLRGAFGERTMLLCDQCEREFHVGCLRSSGRCVLESIPEGADGSVHWQQYCDSFAPMCSSFDPHTTWCQRCNHIASCIFQQA